MVPIILDTCEEVMNINSIDINISYSSQKFILWALVATVADGMERVELPLYTMYNDKPFLSLCKILLCKTRYHPLFLNTSLDNIFAVS